MKTSLLLAVASIAALGTSANAQSSQPFTIKFAAEIGGKPYACTETYAAHCDRAVGAAGSGVLEIEQSDRLELPRPILRK